MLCVHGSEDSRDYASNQEKNTAVDQDGFFAIPEMMKGRTKYSAPDYQEELRAYIIKTVNEEWKSFSDFSRKAFPDRRSASSSFRAIRNSGQNITLEYLVKIANAFEMTPAQVLADVEAVIRQKQKKELALAAEEPGPYDQGNVGNGQV